MTRLIDVDSIPWLVEGVGEIPVITKEEIDQMPTVDAAQVIRCKDCEHWIRKYHYCEIISDTFIDWNADDYCSRAERKDNA